MIRILDPRTRKPVIIEGYTAVLRPLGYAEFQALLSAIRKHMPAMEESGQDSSDKQAVNKYVAMLGESPDAIQGVCALVLRGLAAVSDASGAAVPPELFINGLSFDQLVDIYGETVLFNSLSTQEKKALQPPPPSADSSASGESVSAT